LPETNDSFRRYALLLLALSFLARLPAFIQPGHLPVIVYFEGTYLQTAQDIVHWNIHALGARVPLYPLFIALCGQSPRAIWIAQSLLGIASSLLIYAMAYRCTRHAPFALLVGLGGSAVPEVLAYESSIMSETLATFLIVLAAWLFARYDGVDESPVVYPAAMGVLVGLMALNRPLMICLVPLLFPFVVPVWPLSNLLRRDTFVKAAAFTLPALALILGWCGLVYRNSGSFSPTTLAGRNLMDQVDPWVELAPPQFAVLRETWIEHRERNRNSPIKNVNPVFDESVPEIVAKTGWSSSRVEHGFQSMAIYLIVHHPGLYLRRAEQGWIQFWAEPTRDEVVIPDAASVTPAEFFLTFTDFMVRQVKAMFLVLALISIPCLLLRSQAFSRIDYLIFALALWNSIFAALTEYGENRRFCVPFYLLILYVLMTRGWVWVRGALIESPAS
jgi:hypothetical protein